jgi:hypothetical protein
MSIEYLSGKIDTTPVIVCSSSEKGGRDIVSHEFPNTNVNVLQDMGDTARVFNISFYVTGIDFNGYTESRDSLLLELSKPGLKTFTNPFVGTLRGYFGMYDIEESQDQFKLSKVSCTFTESIDRSTTVRPTTGDAEYQLILVQQARTTLEANAAPVMETLAPAFVNNPLAVSTTIGNYVSTVQRVVGVVRGIFQSLNLPLPANVTRRSNAKLTQTTLSVSNPHKSLLNLTGLVSSTIEEPGLSFEALEPSMSGWLTTIPAKPNQAESLLVWQTTYQYYYYYLLLYYIDIIYNLEITNSNQSRDVLNRFLAFYNYRFVFDNTADYVSVQTVCASAAECVLYLEGLNDVLPKTEVVVVGDAVYSQVVWQFYGDVTGFEAFINLNKDVPDLDYLEDVTVDV